MKINITEEILDYEGKPYLEPNIRVEIEGIVQSLERGGSRESIISELKKHMSSPITFRKAIVYSLNNFIPDEKLTSEEKHKCYELTHKCFATSEPDFTIETEIPLIIKRIGVVYNAPIIVGRIKELFDKKP